jgi:hypothetical protein
MSPDGPEPESRQETMSMRSLQMRLTETVLGVVGIFALPSCLTTAGDAKLGMDEGEVENEASKYEPWPCALDVALEAASERRVSSDEEAWCVVAHGEATHLRIAFLITPELLSGDHWLLRVDIDDIEPGGTGTYPASVAIDPGDGHLWETYDCEVDVATNEEMSDREEYGGFLVVGQGRCSEPARRSDTDSDAREIAVGTFDFEAGVTWDD